jgi:hypothetical protein
MKHRSSARASSSPSTSCSASSAKGEIIKEIFSRFNVKPEQIRRDVEGDRLFVDRISSSAELPLSEESKKILATPRMKRNRCFINTSAQSTC